MNIARCCAFALVFLMIAACKKNSVIHPDPAASRAYMPLYIGSEWIWETDSLVFSKTTNGIKVDTGHYLVREFISDTFTNSSGELVYVADRFVKNVNETSWNIQSVGGLFFDENRYLRKDGNNTFIKFPLPPVKGARWDGLALIDKSQLTEVGGESVEIFKDWESRITGTEQKFDNGHKEYSDCFTVRLADSESLVDLRSGYEVYSKDIGLVYSELMILDTQCGGNPSDCSGIPWDQKAEKGFIVTQRLISFQRH